MGSQKRVKVAQETPNAGATTPVEDIAISSFAKPPIQRLFEILPLELVLEIFAWLRPFELLSLIETNRHIRKILTRKSAAYVWRRSRLNLRGCVQEPIPDPPSYISEIRYTRTLFDVQCYYCGGKAFNDEDDAQVGPVDFAHFRRMCWKCQDTLYTPEDEPFCEVDLPDWYDKQELLEVLHIVAMSYPDCNYLDKFLIQDLEEHIPKLLSLRRDILDNKEGAAAAEAAHIAAGKARIEPFKAFADACVSWSYDDIILGQLVHYLDMFREKELTENVMNRILGYNNSSIALHEWREYYDQATGAQGAIGLWGPEVENTDFLRKADEKVKHIIQEVKREREQARLACAKAAADAKARRQAERAARVAQESVYRCNHCSVNKKPRLFSLEGLKCHSRDKHKLTDLTPADYTKDDRTSIGL